MIYSFTCETETCHYHTNPAFLLDATETVLCGGCGVVGLSKLLTEQEVQDLDLPEVTPAEEMPELLQVEEAE